MALTELRMPCTRSRWWERFPLPLPPLLHQFNYAKGTLTHHCQCIHILGGVIHCSCDHILEVLFDDSWCQHLCNLASDERIDLQSDGDGAAALRQSVTCWCWDVRL